MDFYRQIEGRDHQMGKEMISSSNLFIKDMLKPYGHGKIEHKGTGKDISGINHKLNLT